MTPSWTPRDGWEAACVLEYSVDPERGPRAWTPSEDPERGPRAWPRAWTPNVDPERGPLETGGSRPEFWSRAWKPSVDPSEEAVKAPSGEE